MVFGICSSSSLTDLSVRLSRFGPQDCVSTRLGHHSYLAGDFIQRRGLPIRVMNSRPLVIPVLQCRMNWFLDNDFLASVNGVHGVYRLLLALSSSV